MNLIQETHWYFRKLNGWLLVPWMKVSGFRFSREYRHAEFGWKAFVYRWFDCIGANFAAGLPPLEWPEA